MPDSIAAIFLSASLISIPLQAHAQAVTDADGFSGYTFNDNSVNAPTARGALTVNGALPDSITNSVFSRNSTSGTTTFGGALYIGGDLGGGINGTTFQGNTTQGGNASGGGLYIDGNLNGGVSNSTFAGNTATATASSSQASGGAISASSISGTISQTSFINNKADATAPGGRAYGGALFLSGSLNAGIDASLFSGNAVSGINASGGAIYVTHDLTGNMVNGTTFQNNQASGTNIYGSTIHVGGNFAGNMSNVIFQGNSATGTNALGTLFVSGNFSGDITGSTFSNNTATGNSANSKAAGSALYVSGAFNGDISGSRFDSNSASAKTISGGTIYVEGGFGGNITDTVFLNNSANAAGTVYGGTMYVDSGFSGSIVNATFANNSASGVNVYGGAIDIGSAGGLSGQFSGDISGSTFSGNQARANGGAAYGGAIYAADAFTGTIRDSSFTNNHADTAGGAIFFDTSSPATAHDVTLTSSAGGTTVFQGNTDSSGANSLTFGNTSGSSQQSANLTLTGAGQLMLLDPIRAAMNNGQTLNVSRNTSDGNGQVVWGGVNQLTVDGGTANVAFDSGSTLLLNDFSLVAGNNTTMNVSFGQTHTLSLQLAGRDSNLALFDFTQSTESSGMSIAPGSTIIAQPRSLLAYSGHYLFAEGVSLTQDQLNQFSVQNNAYFQGTLSSDPSTGMVWFDTSYNPYSTSGPNALRAGLALDQWLRDTQPGLSVSDAGFNALLNHLDAATPEAAMSMGLVNSRVHDQMVDSALVSMFQPGAAMISAGYDCAANTGTQAALCTPVPLRVWGNYVGNFIRADDSGGYSGYDADSNGFLLGVTWDINPSWAIGGYAGYSHGDTDFSLLKANNDSDAGHYGVAMRYSAPFGLKLTLDGAYSNFDNQMHRNPADLGSSNGSFNQDVYSLGLTAAYDLTPWQNGRLTPFAGIRQTWLDQDSFTESGGPLDAQVDSTSLNGLATTIGMQVAHDFATGNQTILTPNVSLAWRHEFGDQQMSAMTSFLAPTISSATPYRYDVSSYQLSRDSAQIGLGLDASIGKRWKVRALYSLNVYDHTTENSAYVMTGYTF